MQSGTKNARGAILTLVLAVTLPSKKARDMVKLLLGLGATSAQGDLNQVSAFHYMVAENNDDVLDILLEHDRPAALSVLSKMSFRGSGYHWGENDGDSPVTTAIGRGYQNIVSKLLSLGAKPTLSFDEWIKVCFYSKNSSRVL